MTNTTITPEAVAAILKDVTPGPWENVSYQSGTVQVIMRRCNNAKPDPTCDGSMYGYMSAYMSAYNIGWQDESAIDREKHANARFIAWARNSVEALAADRDAQKARADALEKARDEDAKDYCAVMYRNDDLIRRAEAAEAKLIEWQANQHYQYIGRDGKPVLARDLEARAEAAEAKVVRLVELLLRFLPDYEPWMDEWPDDALASTYKRHRYGDHRAARAAIAEAQE